MTPPRLRHRALLLACVLSSACREYAVQDTLAAYDDYLDDHYVALVDAYEREGVAPPSREAFDDLAQWHWERGTKRRECLVEKGESKRFRDHRYFPCLEEFLRDEDGPLYREMRNAADHLFIHDLYDLYHNDCASVDDDPAKFFHWRDCLAVPGGD